MQWKKLALAVTPPIVAAAYKNARASKAYRGRYESWSKALLASSGYDSPAILEKTVFAMREVKAGRASFARDGVAFAVPDIPFRLLAMLLRQASLDGGRLSVLDFGGALGSTYFQCRKYLEGVQDLKWNVVEQANHVEVGREEFSSDVLRFHESAESCRDDRPNVLLISSVLQYLESPFTVADRLLRLGANTVIVDRTPISVSGEGFLTVQKVPKEIYPASYPSWVFSREKIVSFFERDYSLQLEFESEDNLDPSAKHFGFYFLKK